MKEKEHHTQDASELYAVAVMQRRVEELGRARTHDSETKYAAFRDYASERGLTDRDFNEGPYREYKLSVDRHMPAFVDRLLTTYHGQDLDFVDVEAEYRNQGKKGDFIVRTETDGDTSVSLKNYRNTAASPQVCSGTFNSFLVNFVLEPAGGPGMVLDPVTRETFRGSARSKRDAAFAHLGLPTVVQHLRRLDALNTRIKEQFVQSPDFEYLDEAKFDAVRKDVGTSGAKIAFEALAVMPPEMVKARLLKMTGLDGSEELLLMDPRRCADSLTNPTLRRLAEAGSSDSTAVIMRQTGQSIIFTLADGSVPLLDVNVPFTINKNGAWISDEPYEGTRYHAKEGRELAFGQRRPKKSRELATSVNTYVHFDRAGVFEG